MKTGVFRGKHPHAYLSREQPWHLCLSPSEEPQDLVQLLHSATPQMSTNRITPPTGVFLHPFPLRAASNQDDLRITLSSQAHRHLGFCQWNSEDMRHMSPNLHSGTCQTPSPELLSRGIRDGALLLGSNNTFISSSPTLLHGSLKEGLHISPAMRC